MEEEFDIEYDEEWKEYEDDSSDDLEAQEEELCDTMMKVAT